MVYAYDQWALLPVKDLYDSQIMLASINAAKDMYEKGLQEMKDFKKEYGDFYSPIDKDMDWYTENVTGRVLNVVNQLYNAGIDPLRSAEGRAAISRVINGIDTGRMARNKVSAENAQKYLQAKAVLEAAGKYDPDLEERYLGFNINNWDSENGVWNRLSPAEAKSLRDLTSQSFDKMSPRELSKADVEAFGMEYDPDARYIGITRGDMLDVANIMAPGLTGTIYADYYRDRAAKELMAQGVVNPTKDLINARLAEDITDSNLKYMKKPIADKSDYYQREGLKLKKQANAIAAIRANGGGHNNPFSDSWTNRQMADMIQNGTNRIIPRGNDLITAYNIFTGMRDKKKQNVLSGDKHHNVSFSENGVVLSASIPRIIGLTNGGSYIGTPGPKVILGNKKINVETFNEFLKKNNITGYVPYENDVTVERNIDENDNAVWDFESIVRIPYDKLERYFKDLPDATVRYMLDGCGAKLVNEQGKVIIDYASSDNVYSKPIQVAGNINYIEMPVTRRVNSSDVGDYQINLYHIGNVFGKSKAAGTTSTDPTNIVQQEEQEE